MFPAWITAPRCLKACCSFSGKFDFLLAFSLGVSIVLYAVNVSDCQLLVLLMTMTDRVNQYNEPNQNVPPTVSQATRILQFNKDKGLKRCFVLSSKMPIKFLFNLRLS